MTRTAILLDGRTYWSDSIKAAFPLTDAELALVPSLDKAKQDLHAAQARGAPQPRG